MNDTRLSKPPANEHCEPFQINAFEVSFGMPVWITAEDQNKFNELFDSIVKQTWNQPAEGVHWMAGCGSKPSYSKADAAFLGMKADPDAPDTGEPTFDEDVYFMESVAREFVSNEERDRVSKRRANTPT